MRPREKPERPADPAVRRANLRRVIILFSPYRLRLGAVLALICFSALLGIVSPFLVRDIFDHALPENVVGQRVMHDLRAAVYKHLQRLSLAFFTRTRTGEVQSRIANDIGGVERVV